MRVEGDGFLFDIWLLVLTLFFFLAIRCCIGYSATLNYSTGVVLMTFTETIDVPLGWSTTTNLQQVYLQNISASSMASNDTAGTISMQGAFVTARDSHVVEITLVEEQRARAIALSGVVVGRNEEGRSGDASQKQEPHTQDVGKN